MASGLLRSASPVFYIMSYYLGLDKKGEAIITQFIVNAATFDEIERRGGERNPPHPLQELIRATTQALLLTDVKVRLGNRSTLRSSFYSLFYIKNKTSYKKCCKFFI